MADMDERTLTALKGSIEKWEKIVAGTGTDEGMDNCPLCQEFVVGNCKGCPVRVATGHMRCIESPYDAWSDLDDGFGVANTPERKAAAQAELDFLRSLLPDGE